MAADNSEHKWTDRLSWPKFYTLMLREVFEHSWGWTDFIATLFGVIIPLWVHFRPKMEQRLTPLTWEIPLGVFASIGAMRLLAAPFLLYRDHHIFATDTQIVLQNELQAEREKLLQPEVGLVWGWPERYRNNMEQFERGSERFILVHNRSTDYMHNIQVQPIVLESRVEFDLIPEIAPSKTAEAVGRWDSKT